MLTAISPNTAAQPAAAPPPTHAAPEAAAAATSSRATAQDTVTISSAGQHAADIDHDGDSH